jgi:ketosteroid isomerase-like protein
MKKVVYFLLLISIIPTLIEAQVTPSPFTEAEARQFIDEYRERFARRDLDAYMALFSREATENRMLPYADIQMAYKRTIALSQSIQYQLKIYSIQTDAKSAFVQGRYEILQAFKKGGKARLMKGDIQWVLAWEDGSLKIREINYGKDR